MIILAIDHGTKLIGVAVCDELEIAARPLCVFPHTSKEKDAQQVVQLIAENKAEKVLIGVSYTEDGFPNDSGWRALNFMSVLQAQTSCPVETWDESLTTQDARAIKLQMGLSKKKRQGHHDSTAAAVLLQEYIDRGKFL